MIQALILVLSGLAAILVACKGRGRRLVGFCVGIVGLPLWYYTTWKTGQWGIFVLTMWYTVAYFVGVYSNLPPRKVLASTLGKCPCGCGASKREHCWNESDWADVGSEEVRFSPPRKGTVDVPEGMEKSRVRWPERDTD